MLDSILLRHDRLNIEELSSGAYFLTVVHRLNQEVVLGVGVEPNLLLWVAICAQLLRSLWIGSGFASVILVVLSRLQG